MSKLLLLANEFPFGSWEPYIETECEYYKGFDKIWICSLQLRDEHAKSKRKLNIDAEIIPVRYVSRLQYLLESVVVFFDSNLYKEIGKLVKQKRIHRETLVSLFVFLSRAHHEAGAIDKKLRGEDKADLVFYSYRFEYQPYVAILLKKKWRSNGKIRCRAHGYDLYEERHKENYIPLRETVLEAVEAVYPCSKDGLDYLQSLFPKYKEKIQVRYLGTKDHGLNFTVKREGIFRIVSCSGVTKVKRVDRIVDALALIKNAEIEWIHYGDGPLFDELTSYAAQKLENNIRFTLKGNVRNCDLLEAYSREQYHLFLNVSSSEGIPVSIMEALSFGIPCIATNVGGTGEILSDRSFSRLLDADFADYELCKAILEYCGMSDEEYRKQRISARDHWKRNFNADVNYVDFFLDF